MVQEVKLAKKSQRYLGMLIVVYCYHDAWLTSNKDINTDNKHAFKVTGTGATVGRDPRAQTPNLIMLRRDHIESHRYDSPSSPSNSS